MRVCALTLGVLLGFLPSFAAAEVPNLDSLIKKGGQAVLEYADKVANPFPDLTMTVQMRLEGGSDDGRILKMEMLSKDASKIALRFETPADLKGLALVIKGASEIYVKLPGSRKVRRVATHARKQSFQGTDWSMDDLRILKLAPVFNAKIKEVTSTHLVLDLTKKEGADVPYSRIVAYLPKDHLIPDKLEYYNEEGKNIKVQVRSDLKVVGGKKTFGRSKMTDLIRNHSTYLEVLERKLETIPENSFSKRWLVRGA